MIYVTGDVHVPIDVSKLNSRCFPEQKRLTKADCLIICGDFGGVWDGGAEELYWRKWLSEKNFTTLFVDGNHENFSMLRTFDTVQMYGGMAHRVSDSIYHLERRQIFTIQNKSFFVLGGAASRDRDRRKEGKSWWPEEIPSAAEIATARKTLDDAGWKVDYILTHCAPMSLQNKIAPSYPVNVLTDFLEEIRQKAQYLTWYFGHYHVDRALDDKHVAVFGQVRPV